MELTLPNSDGRLSPGGYVRVSLPLAPKGALSIPANTLLFRAEGPNVAVIDDAGRAHLRPVTIANDLGATLEIAHGLGPDGPRHRQPAGFAGRGRPDHALTPLLSAANPHDSAGEAPRRQSATRAPLLRVFRP